MKNSVSKRIKRVALRAALDIVSHNTPSEHALKRVPVRHKEESISLLKETNGWSQTPNVVGFGIASKKTAGKLLGETCLKIYVKRKLPQSKLSGKKRIPLAITIFDRSQEIITDIDEIGVIEPQSYSGRYRPAYPGCSIAHSQGNPGTFGCVVYREDQRFILSCSHVVARSGEASVGDAILQPKESATNDNLIGRLVEFVPFDFTPFPNDQVDAGLVTPNEMSSISDTFVDGAEIHGCKLPREEMTVQLVGFASGHTFGQIVDTFFRTTINYPTGTVQFSDQLLCTKMSTEGDSGSLLRTLDNHAVGLLIGGSSNTSVFNPIRSVLRKLNVDITS